jgi:GT2 family glycosyltransferase
LRIQAGYLSQHGEIGMVVGDALVYDGRQDLNRLSTRTGKPRNFQDFRWETVDFCPYPSTCIVRRTCFEAIGGFDERFRRSGGEDWLFAVQLALVGGLAYLDQPIARYRLHGGNVTSNASLVHAQNRLAARAAVEWGRFAEYPPAMQARLLYFCFACSWHSEPRAQAMHHLWAALRADPRQWRYGTRVLSRGLAAAVQRRWSGTAGAAG